MLYQTSLNNNKERRKFKFSCLKAVNYNLKYLIEIYAATKINEENSFGMNQQKQKF